MIKLLLLFNMNIKRFVGVVVGGGGGGSGGECVF